MKKAVAVIVMILFIISLFSGCSSQATTTTTTSSMNTTSSNATSGSASITTTSKVKEIYFAVIGPLTGNGAQYGESYKNATTLKVNEINAKGGINGATIKLDFFDDKNDAKEAANVAQLVASNKKYLAVLGPFSSTACLAAAPIFADSGMLQFIPTASHADITLKYKHTIRQTNTMQVESPYVAYTAIKKLGKTKIAVIYANNDAGIATKDNFVAGVSKYGGEMVAVEAFNQDETNDFIPILNKVLAKKPELIHVTGTYTDIGTMLAQSAQLDTKSISFLCPGTVYTPDFLNIAGKQSEGVYINTAFFADNPDPKVAEFVKNYKVVSGGKAPDMFAAATYDSMAILLDVLSKGSLEISRSAYKDAVLATKSWDGVSGKSTYDINRDVNKSMITLKVVDGKFVVAPQN